MLVLFHLPPIPHWSSPICDGKGGRVWKLSTAGVNGNIFSFLGRLQLLLVGTFSSVANTLTEFKYFYHKEITSRLQGVTVKSMELLGQAFRRDG